MTKANSAAAKAKSRTNLAWMVAGVAMVLLGTFLFLGKGPDNPAVSTAHAAPTTSEVSYPVADFAGGKAKFFEHRMADGLVIRYFLLQSSDGTIRAAFDACDACWAEGKGYRQDGDEMVCQNCRMRFSSRKVGEVKGGCNPSPLARRVEGGRVTILVSDIEAGARFFRLPAK